MKTSRILTLIFPFLISPVLAADESDLIFQVEDGQASVVGCRKEASGVLAIPQFHRGFPVTAIGESAFQERDLLTDVIIPTGVGRIERQAFANTSLTNVEIPETVEWIGPGAFRNMLKLRSVSIPRNLTSIQLGAFTECRLLTHVSIPAKVESIGIAAFKGCRALKSVVFMGSAPKETDKSAFDSVAFGAKAYVAPDHLGSFGELHSLWNGLTLAIGPDSDGDGLPDSVETGDGHYQSSDATGTKPDDPDSDRDGLSDGEEVFRFGTNPNEADSDGDGFNDGAEVRAGTSPLSSGETPDAKTEVNPAVEFAFFSQVDAKYQIQWTTDLEKWIAVPETIQGTGDRISRLFSTSGARKRFYRVVLIKEPG